MKKLVGILFAAMLGLNSAWGDRTTISDPSDNPYTVSGPGITGNSVIDGNPSAGGGIYITSSGSVPLISALFAGNEAKNSVGNAYGGAIANYSTAAIANTNNEVGIGGIVGDFILNLAEGAGAEVFGGAIYNIGNIGYISVSSGTGFFNKNSSKNSSVDGLAFGGAIYNVGNIGTISGNFIENNAVSTGSGGLARGGAIYTTSDLTFLADNGSSFSFNKNYTQDTLGKIYNAIFISGNGSELSFNTKRAGSIILNDQIQGDVDYNIRITGDDSGNYVKFNNLIIGAEEVIVENTQLTLGSSQELDAAFKDGNDYNHGIFVDGQNPDYDDYTTTTSMSLDNSQLILNYLGSSSPDLKLKDFTMKNGSIVNLGNSVLSAANYIFYNIDNEINGIAVVNMNFKDLNLYFHIPGTAVNGNTILTVNGTANIQGSVINIMVEGDSSSLVAGDKINLITATTLNGDFDNSAVGGLDRNITQGVSLVYGLKLDKVDNNLVVEVIGKNLNPETKSFSEGSLAGLAFVNQSADLVAGAGISNAVKSAKNAQSDFGTFGAVAGGKSRYKTGSHVDVDGFSIMAGLAGAIGDFTLGGFIEYGNGNYNSLNEFAGMDPVKAKGDMNYAGGGLFAHYDMFGGLYAEGSVRGGRINNNFESGDFSSAPIAAFDASAGYYGGHVGIGYLSELAGGSELDTSVKYLATMQEKYDALVSAGETIKFDSVFSQRVRGAAVLRIGNGLIRPFVGAGADYEFGAKQKASIYGMDVDAPMISGLTGIGQAGLAIETNDLTLSLGGEGYLGARQGFGAMLSFKYRFGAKERAPEPENESVRASSMFGAPEPQPTVRAMSAFAAPVETERNITHAVEAAGNYIVQVGAFYNEDMAEQAKNQVSYLGTPTVRKGKGDMYRVQFRDLSSDDANRIMETLENDEGMKPGLIKGGRWQHRRGRRSR